MKSQEKVWYSAKELEKLDLPEMPKLATNIINWLIPKFKHYRQYDYAQNVALFRKLFGFCH